MAKRRILILGGGFAGIRCARYLESRHGEDQDVEIVVVSEDNFLLFTPMLPQVASGMIETRHIVAPIRTVCRRARFYEGRVRDMDPGRRRVTLWGTRERPGISLGYDFLVVALGSETNFFGMADVERNAYTMKTLNDAVMLRNRAIDMLEQAENEDDPVRRRGLLSFVVAGAGFAGIETAGELMDLLLDARSHYPHIRSEDINIAVLEALPGILPGFDQKLASFARERMARRGIEIRTDVTVTGFDGERVHARDSRGQEAAIAARTLVWTAGVRPVNTVRRSVFGTEGGKIMVDGSLMVPGFAGVFAIGDCALCTDPSTGRPFAPTAQLAEAQAVAAGKNISALIGGGRTGPFKYRPKGQMAVIGKRTGIATFLGINMAGFWAWVVWRNLYLSKIPSWEKRIRVLIDWTADLFFGRDISRLKLGAAGAEKEYRVLNEVDEVW